MIHYDKCPLCLSEKINLHLQTEDHFLSRENYSLIKCTDCGFLFTQDHPDAEHIGKYYESDAYLSHNDSAKGFSGRLYRLSRRLMLRKKRETVKSVTGRKTGDLLDIGSGAGHFLNEMKSSGWNVLGIEINDGARESSVSEFGIDVLPPEKIPDLPEAGFDCITLWHVLEHFQDPFGYAADIWRLLKPEGVCIIALPNCRSSDAMHYSEFWAAYDVPRHLWHFTPETFSRFAEKTGFKTESIKRLPLDVFYISALSEKYKGSTLSFIRGMIKGFWFSLLATFNKQNASSLIYLLKK
jgi:2-polyprenyl-3-methyl-5-hydroxy-6-metoxy-1,4-benzoquinol methylase